MVNRYIVSKYVDAPPTEAVLASGSRRINKKYLYDIADIRKLASTPDTDESVLAWTAGAKADISGLLWDMEDVKELILHALDHGRRLKPEWCVQSPDGPLAACDVFIVSRHEVGKRDNVRRIMQYYLKFAVSKTGRLLLIASCHTTEK